MEKIVFVSETSYEVATTVQVVYLDKYIIQRRGKYKFWVVLSSRFKLHSMLWYLQIDRLFLPQDNELG